MSREIKFRAWTGKKMMYQDNQYLGSFIRRVVMQVMLDRAMDTPREHESYLPAGTSIDDYLLQYINREDKNERKIYEGDIFSHAPHWEDGRTVSVVRDIHEFCGEEGMYGSVDEIEVIGNIYENPEMVAKQ